MEDKEKHQRQYNYIYSKLVSDETDIFGHIAYALYKGCKVQFIENLKVEGKVPTEEDLQPFHQISCLDTTLERYRIQAAAILDAFLNEVLAKHKTDIERNYIEQQDKRLGEVVKPMKPKFWNGVLQSLIGAFFFACILAAFAFVYTYCKDDTSVKMGTGAAKTIQLTETAICDNSLVSDMK